MGSLDLLMESHLVELRAELHQLKPFSGVPTIFLGRVTGHAGRTLFGSGNGPAFGALESDNDPTPLFLAIKDVAPQVRSELTNKELTWR